MNESDSTEAQAIAPSDPGLSPAGVLARCPECGYDLRGLPPLGRDQPCPECGYPASLYAPPSDWLRHSDPMWLRRIHRGLLLQEWSGYALLAMLLSALVLVVPAVIGGLAADLVAVGLLGEVEPAFTWLFWIPAAIGLSGIPAHIAGCWLAGTPTAARSSGTRRVVRVCGMAFAPACCLAVVPLAALFPAAPSWAHVARPALAIALATCYLLAIASWCKDLEHQSETWTLTAPRRYRNLRKVITGAAIVAVLFDLLLTVGPMAEASASPGGPGSESGPDLWPLCFTFGFVAAVERAIIPARRAVGHELRNSIRA